MDWNRISDTASNFATVMAVLVGGVWTYLLFVRQRLSLPRIQCRMESQAVNCQSSRLVRAAVQVTNVGAVVARFAGAELRLRQVLPLPPDTDVKAAGGFDPVKGDDQQVIWPLLTQREWKWKEGEFEIEPGESDLLCADFFVAPSVQVVELYFFLKNPHRKRQDLGWPVSKLVSLQ